MGGHRDPGARSSDRAPRCPAPTVASNCPSFRTLQWSSHPSCGGIRESLFRTIGSRKCCSCELTCHPDSCVSAITPYLTKHWIELTGLLVSIGFAFYFYEQSREEREPIFVVDPNRVEILRAERVATAPIRVLR